MAFPNKATQFKNGEHAVQAGKKGGSVKSPAKRLAAQLRNLKKNPTEANLERMYEIMSNSEMSSLDIYRQVKDMMSRTKTLREEDMVVSKLIDVHKLVHGTKTEESKIFNVTKVEITVEKGSNEKKIDVEVTPE